MKLSTLCIPKISSFGKEHYEQMKNTLREVVLGMDHSGSVPKQDLECLMLPKLIPKHLMMRKAASQPC